jgi:proline racemase
MRWSKRISVINVHAAGEVGRVIAGGVFDIPGKTMADKKRHLEREGDDLRRFCLFEPRGAAAMSVNLLLPPSTTEADLGVIIMESTDYPAMSGSNLMCVCTAALETGIVPMKEPVTHLKIETPAGVLPVKAICQDGKCVSVTLDNVPSFVERLGATIEVKGVGSVLADIAFGGAFFAIVDAPKLGFAMTPDEARDLVDLGEKIKSAAAAQYPVVHPIMPDVVGVTFTLFGGPPAGPDRARKSAVVISPGRLDRSPCGTGTCARLAVLSARREIPLGASMIHESLLGTRFTAEVVEELEVAGRPAIVPRLTGQAWIFGTAELALDPTDPFPLGFTLTDTWGDGVKGLNELPAAK